MAYDVCFTEAALKSLQRCSPKDKDFIFKGIEQLAEDPLNKSNVKKLVNFDAATYRLRVEGTTEFYLTVRITWQL